MNRRSFAKNVIAGIGAAVVGSTQIDKKNDDDAKPDAADMRRPTTRNPLFVITFEHDKENRRTRLVREGFIIPRGVPQALMSQERR